MEKGQSWCRTKEIMFISKLHFFMTLQRNFPLSFLPTYCACVM